MGSLIALAISSGIVAGLWTIWSITGGLSMLVGFLGWSSFFAAGAGIKGMRNGLIANLSGVLWGFFMLKLSIFLTPTLGEIWALALSNALGAIVICLQSKISVLSFIPASFIGWSAFIASGMDLRITLVSIVLGSALGYNSQKLTEILSIRIPNINAKLEVK